MSKYRTKDASLKNKTPLWWQTDKSNGYPVGCGSAAWAIVFGYWKQYKGKSKLLDGITMPHSQEETDVDLGKNMEEIAKDTECKDVTYKGKKYGRNKPWKMDKAKKYIKRRGYDSSIGRLRGREFKKFRKVKDWIEKDRPVIILISNPKKPLSSLHYLIIEKAELTQRKKFRKWRDRVVRYYVNRGSGKREWIWVRERGKNRHKRTGSFSMFFLRID